jgi:hypothetical protein
MSNIVKRNLFAAGYAFQWLGLRYLFLFAQQRWELGMMASGLTIVWWLIAFLYFVADATMLALFGYIGTRNGWSPIPEAYPFRYIAADLVLVAFVFHLYWLSIDHVVYVRLESLGLRHLSAFFLLVATAWVGISILRARSVRKMIETKS